MLVSRGLSALKVANLLKNCSKLNTVSIRNSHAPWSYRTSSPPPRKMLLLAASGVQGFMWWWVFWHFYTDYGHVIGEFEYPDTSKWTDEELGIPPKKK